MTLTMKRILVGSGLIASMMLPGVVSAEYIFTAPPRESKVEGEKVYGPIAEHLSTVLKTKVSYVHPGNWRKYKKDMIKGSYDIVFDGPHFAAWRMDKKQAAAAVKLPGNLSFVLVSRQDAGVKTKEDLVGKKICTLPPPNLGAMTVYSMYPNQMSQPEFKFIKGGMKKVAMSLEAGKCDAAILRKVFYEKKATDKLRSTTVVLESSRPYVNQGFTLNARIPAEQRSQIINALTQGEGKKAAKLLFNRFAGNAPGFVVADTNEYTELNLLKKNNMFGW